VTSWRTDPKTCASSPAARNPTPAHNWLCSNRSMGGASSSWPPTHPAGPRSSSKPATDHTPAWKTTFTPASKPASDTYPPPRSRSTEPGAWPRPSPATCCAGYGCSACMEHWPAPNRRPCATGCCIPQPASCAANANTQSASPEPGPGQANSLPASARHSRCPHQLDVDQHKPAPTTAPTPGPWNPALTQRDSRASNPNSTLTTTIMKINIWEPEATLVNPRMIKASRRPRPEPPDSSSVYRTRVRHLNSTEAAVDRAHLPLTQQRPVATPPLRGALASCSTGRPIGSSWTP
jgi:hypothetical protein